MNPCTHHFVPYAGGAVGCPQSSREVRQKVKFLWWRFFALGRIVGEVAAGVSRSRRAARDLGKGYCVAASVTRGF